MQSGSSLSLNILDAILIYLYEWSVKSSLYGNEQLISI